jgi:hypothetical protein
VDDSGDTAHQWLDGKFAITVGLAGFDGAKHDARPHDWHVEIHPVYALFVRVNDDPFNPKWAFFVRNWGDEGFCADGQWPMGRAVLQVVLPGPGSPTNHHGSINLYPVEGAPTLENVWAYGDDEAERNKLSWGWQANPNGVLLTFNLSPTAQVGIVGDVQFKFRQPVLAARPPTLVHAVPPAKRSRTGAPELTEGTPATREVAVQFEKLPPALQRTAMALVRGTPTHLKPVRMPASSIDQVLVRANALRSGSTPSSSHKAFDDSAIRAAREARRKASAEFIKSHSTP